MKLINLNIICFIVLFYSGSLFATDASIIKIQPCNLAANAGLNKVNVDTSSMCIFDTRRGAGDNILSLGQGDVYDNISISTITGRKKPFDLLVLEFGSEPNGETPHNKIIILSVGELRIVPLLITYSWWIPNLIDVNGDGVLDIELFTNPFLIESSDLIKWPVLIDGKNIENSFPLSKVPVYMKTVIDDMEEQINNLKNDCNILKQDGFECLKLNDLDKIERQLKALKLHISN